MSPSLVFPASSLVCCGWWHLPSPSSLGLVGWRREGLAHLLSFISRGRVLRGPASMEGWQGTALYNSGSKQIVGGGFIHVSEGGRVTGLALLCQVYVQSISCVQSEQQLIVCCTRLLNLLLFIDGREWNGLFRSCWLDRVVKCLVKLWRV